MTDDSDESERSQVSSLVRGIERLASWRRTQTGG